MKLLKKNLYQQFIEKQLPLNDQLAAARSILSNERTFLSYQRTALTFSVAGISFIKFFNGDDIVYYLGWVFIPVALVSMILGTYRYIRMRDLIRSVEIDSCEQIEQKKKNNPFRKKVLDIDF